MDQEQLIAQIENLTVWKQRGVRAPHKPLLLLLTLARVQSDQARLWEYADLEPQLKELLQQFGPRRKTYAAHHPFWRLQNDGDFWDIPQRPQLQAQLAGRTRQGDLPPGVLKQEHTQGGFSPQVYQLLRSDPALVNRLAARLLYAHFPPSLHEDILDAIGMPWVPYASKANPRGRPPRDPSFRREVLRIYEYRCAICGFDGRLAGSDLGLEAAHVRWHSAEGPDQTDNGLALCVFHHKAFDKGALGLSLDHKVLVSQDVHGNTGVQDWLLRHHQQPLRGPQPGTSPVAPEYIQWHTRQVFRTPARL